MIVALLPAARGQYAPAPYGPGYYNPYGGIGAGSTLAGQAQVIGARRPAQHRQPKSLPRTAESRASEAHDAEKSLRPNAL